MKFLLPIAILLAAIAVAGILIALRPGAETSEPTPYIPAVETLTAEAETVRIQVKAQGNVLPRTETALTADVGGRILKVSEHFDNGAFFNKGDILIEFDPLPYEVELAQARSRLASARLALVQEIAQAEQAREEWQLSGIQRSSEPSALVLRQPQIEMAEADIAAAEAAVRIAERNLEHTRVRAPYDGRVRERRVNLGQVTAPNSTVLGQIYAVDTAEIRLPLTLREYALLGMHEQGGQTPDTTRPVQVTAKLGNSEQEWQGRIVRSEGNLDPRNRMIHVIARIDDPFQRNGGEGPILQTGRFVSANIQGITLQEAFRIPRDAVIHPDQVRIVDNDNRLHSRRVTIIQSTETEAIVTEGLESGDRINLSSIDYFVEGMEVAP